MKTYEELRKINVNEHIEKKNNLTYLSWAWAVDQLFLADETATWEYRWFQDQPYLKVGETFMVFCTVKAFGRERTAQLPIMNYKNQAMTEFTTFDLNTTMQRCLAKAISLHGIGLYIYAGEDLPPEAGEVLAQEVSKADTKPTSGAWESLTPDVQTWLHDLSNEVRALLTRGDTKGACDHLEDAKLSADLKVAIWTRFDSKERSAMKKYRELAKVPA